MYLIVSLSLDEENRSVSEIVCGGPKMASQVMQEFLVSEMYLDKARLVQELTRLILPIHEQVENVWDIANRVYDQYAPKAKQETPSFPKCA
jgi:hypothetical protein